MSRYIYLKIKMVIIFPLNSKAVEYYMHVITNATKTNKTILEDELA